MPDHNGRPGAHGSDKNRQWALYWPDINRDRPVTAHPVLREWIDLTQREEALGLGPEVPVLLDPQGHADVRLIRFFRRSRYAALARSTREAYALDLRLFLNFLALRETRWDEASSDDLADFEQWRRRDPSNPARIGGARWNRALAALRLFYDWAAQQRLISGNPVVTRSVQLPGGATADSPVLKAKDVRTSNVKWLTLRAYQTWRNVGLLGYGSTGFPKRTGGVATTAATPPSLTIW